MFDFYYGEVHAPLSHHQTLTPANAVRDTSLIVHIDTRRLAAAASDALTRSGSMLGILIERAL